LIRKRSATATAFPSGSTPFTRAFRKAALEYDWQVSVVSQDVFK
jgi:hypothetical protein